MTQIQLQALTELKKLMDARIINEAEFALLKKRILDDNGCENTTYSHQGEACINGNRPKKLNNGLWIIIGPITFFVLIIIIYFVASSKYHSNESSSYWEENATEVVEEVVEVSPYEY